MGQVKQFAFRLAEALYEKGECEEQIVEEVLCNVRLEERDEAEAWLRKQMEVLKENPYPTRNMLE